MVGEVKQLQNELIGALIGLVRATEGNPTLVEETYEILVKGIYISGKDDPFLHREGN